MFYEFHKVENGQIVATIRRGGTYNNVSYGKRMSDEEYQAMGWYGEINEVPALSQYQRLGESKTVLDDDTKTVIKTFEVIDFTLEEKITSEQAAFRAKRDGHLKECDIAIFKAEDRGEDTTELRKLRQSLRDATVNWVMPNISILL
ncbi:MAG TPA: hypothetical protein CFH81_02130 [Sulfurovum sp. UBA12169]|nr:MAG TPA: hypothetical protein CFH81_02130 [Sulfurovum sp. UBA12169]